MAQNKLTLTDAMIKNAIEKYELSTQQKKVITDSLKLQSTKFNELTASGIQRAEDKLDKAKLIYDKEMENIGNSTVNNMVEKTIKFIGIDVKKTSENIAEFQE